MAIKEVYYVYAECDQKGCGLLLSDFGGSDFADWDDVTAALKKAGWQNDDDGVFCDKHKKGAPK